jgi:hypothetical protein
MSPATDNSSDQGIILYNFIFVSKAFWISISLLADLSCYSHQDILRQVNQSRVRITGDGERLGTPIPGV